MTVYGPSLIKCIFDIYRNRIFASWREECYNLVPDIFRTKWHMYLFLCSYVLTCYLLHPLWICPQVTRSRRRAHTVSNDKGFADTFFKKNWPNLYINNFAFIFAIWQFQKTNASIDQINQEAVICPQNVEKSFAWQGVIVEQLWRHHHGVLLRVEENWVAWILTKRNWNTISHSFVSLLIPSYGQKRSLFKIFNLISGQYCFF